MPIACRPEADKKTRLFGVSAMIEAGQLLLPQESSWLAELKLELLAFPSSRHDDQVDALSQLLSWVAARTDALPSNVGPILFIAHEDGSTEVIGDTDFLDGYDDEGKYAVTWEEGEDPDNGWY